MATRTRRVVEAEPVLVARTTTEIVLILDDGDELRFDAGELCAAIDDIPFPTLEEARQERSWTSAPNHKDGTQHDPV